MEKKFVISTFSTENSTWLPRLYVPRYRQCPITFDSIEEAEEYMVREGLYGEFVIVPYYQKYE